MAGKFPNKKLSLKTDYDQRERRAGVALKIGGPRNCCYLLLRLLRTCSFAFALLAAGLRSRNQLHQQLCRGSLRLDHDDAWTLTALILLGFAVQFLTLHKGMP